MQEGLDPPQYNKNKRDKSTNKGKKDKDGDENMNN